MGYLKYLSRLACTHYAHCITKDEIVDAIGTMRLSVAFDCSVHRVDT